MRTDKLVLSSMYDGEPDFWETWEKFLKYQLAEYTEKMEVEIVWNFAEDDVDEITINVCPDCSKAEEISNKLPLALFPLSALLDEWFKNLEDVWKYGNRPKVEKYKRWLKELAEQCLRIADRFEREVKKAENEEKQDDEFKKAFNAAHPDLTFTVFHQKREEAEAEFRKTWQS